MAKSTQSERIADLMADNIVLRGIVAYLLAKAEPDTAAREAAIKRLLTTIKPQIDEHIKFHSQMNPQAGEKELQRIRDRGGEIIDLAIRLS